MSVDVQRDGRGVLTLRLDRPDVRNAIDDAMTRRLIDELSAASVSGHTDELATAGRVRQRYLDLLTRTDPHPMGADRVNDTLRHAPGFAEAFGCRADAPGVQQPGPQWRRAGRCHR